MILSALCYEVKENQDWDGDGKPDDPFKNKVYIEAHDKQWHDQLTEEEKLLHWIDDDAETGWVDVYRPSLTITKTKNKDCAAVGEDVIFVITVVNTGDVLLTFDLTDRLVGTGPDYIIVDDYVLAVDHTVIFTGDSTTVDPNPLDNVD